MASVPDGEKASSRVLLPIRSTSPPLKRQRAQYFDSTSEDLLESQVESSQTSELTSLSGSSTSLSMEQSATISSTSSSSVTTTNVPLSWSMPTSSAPYTIGVARYDEEQTMSFRVTALRALGVRDSFDMSRIMEIPEEFFWGDQHPPECSCYWCDQFFGTFWERDL